MANESKKTKLENGLCYRSKYPKDWAKKISDERRDASGIKSVFLKENVPNVIQTLNTLEKRFQLWKRLDPFTQFYWGGVNTFLEFGAFIIADKRGDLKASVGPSFSNNYTKPQFESSAGQLQGVTFNTFQIRFKIGLYWISDDHYRKFLKWFDPYKVDFLKFEYDKNWSYQVKLASISEGTKYVLGYENKTAYLTTDFYGSTAQNPDFLSGKLIEQDIYEDNNKKVKKNIPFYYIETDVVFDIVGENCAYGESYTFQDPVNNILQMENTDNNKVKSILDSSFIFTGIIENNNNNDNKEYSLKISYYEENNKILEEEVFKIKFNKNNSDYIYIQYNSDTGLIYWGTSDNSYKLLTLQQLYNGERLVSTFNSKKIKIPGEQKASLDYSNIKFEYSSGLNNCKIKWRPRINII